MSMRNILLTMNILLINVLSKNKDAADNECFPDFADNEGFAENEAFVREFAEREDVVKSVRPVEIYN